MSKFILTSALALCLLSLAAASIESNEPVKVTHRNSGPRYDIDDVERTRMGPPEPEQSSGGGGASGLGEREEPSPNVARVSIRRIFLVPMMPGPMQPPDSLWSSSSSSPASSAPSDEAANKEPEVWRPRHHQHLFGGAGDPDSQNESGSARPMFPMSLSHLFGQDQASRSPEPKWTAERQASEPDNEAARQRFQAAVMDPIQMMIEMMQQAMQQAHNERQPQAADSDLNKEASSKPEPETEKSDSIRPVKEAKEEVVEIDGKKYLRKSVVSKHVGENMIFMTKRLIFTPLNETDASTTTTTTTTTAQPINAETTQAPEASSTTPSTTTTEELKKAEETTTTNAPAQPEKTTEASTAVPVKPEEMTTPKAQ